TIVRRSASYAVPDALRPVIKQAAQGFGKTR
ncbi:hypothetical protein Pgy4_30976, partial [Pseudomonas savastanoi pv. glycinea str. race 4]